MVCVFGYHQIPYLAVVEVEVVLGRLIPLVINDLLNLAKRHEPRIDGLQALVYLLVRKHVRFHTLVYSSVCLSASLGAGLRSESPPVLAGARSVGLSSPF